MFDSHLVALARTGKMCIKRTLRIDNIFPKPYYGELAFFPVFCYT